ncbi:J domain-containing protein [Flavobacterium sp. XS2P24]|uniref:J domain-containing protein n=1 Tax=Flavobacterium sp. XS2P24 TaxID=3041249 RepID=UPI0024A7FF51|nr:J domain-containing protein [Flavobacterium sp. XS2P24]MDI6048245.1 J domain-containing protein [Flavobacterium sp. XS2P24]
MITLLSVGEKIVSVEKISIFNSIWFWLTLIELLIIIFLVYKLNSKKKVFELSDLETKQIKDSKKNNIDMTNLMNSIHNARPLYKELSKKCHPDRFINEPRQKIAEEIFQKISENERNFKELTLLKSRAVNELNINF